MISYDYEIKRLEEGQREEIYTPKKIPKELENIVYIEGPNSSGKSTLLHLIALGFYGLGQEKDGIAKALKKKMKRFIDQKRNKTTFKISLGNEKKEVLLVSEKKIPDNGEIDVYEVINGKNQRIGKDLFLRKYNLIYDIPEDPTTRISQLILEISEIQRRYGDRIKNLKEYLEKIIKEINSSSNPNRKNELNKLISQRETEIEELFNDLKNKKKILDLLEKATYAKFYSFYKERSSKTWTKILALKQTLKKYEVKKKQSSKDHEVYYPQLLRQISRLSDLQREIYNLFNALEIPNLGVIKVFSKIDLEKISEDLSFPKALEGILNDLSNQISKFSIKFEENENYQQAHLYSDLINTLQKYVSIKSPLPGLNKSIKDFVKDLEESLKENNLYLENVEKVKKLKDLLNQFIQIKGSMEMTLFPPLRDLKKERGELSFKENGREERVFSLEKEHKKYKEKLNEYERDFMRKGKPEKIKFNFEIDELKRYKTYSEDELKSEISRILIEIERDSSRLSNKENGRDLLKNDLKKLGESKPSKYAEKLDQIEYFFKIIEELQSKLETKFPSYLDKVRSSENGKDFDSNQKNYNQAVFKYLGKRVEFYRHINKEYKVDSIDLINEVLNTKDGKKIYFDEMGTGQSQSAYLLGKLNTPDERPIIALFDEVAMMDQESLEPIFKRCRELYKSGKLIAAVIVQKGNEIKIESKVAE